MKIFEGIRNILFETIQTSKIVLSIVKYTVGEIDQFL